MYLYMSARVKSLVKCVACFPFLLLLSCASQNSVTPSPNASVIDYSKAEYINILSLDSITAGFQKLKPSYSVVMESGYRKFSYNFEMNNSSKIIEAYSNYCGSKGGKYLSSDWTVGLCSKSEAVRDSMFFVKIRPVEGFGGSFKFVNLWVIEPVGEVSIGYEEFVYSNGYLSPEEIKLNQNERMQISEAQRVYFYVRTIGSKICKAQGGENVSGIVENVSIEKIQIRLENQKLIWEMASDWKPCK